MPRAQTRRYWRNFKFGAAGLALILMAAFALWGGMGRMGYPLDDPGCAAFRD